MMHITNVELLINDINGELMVTLPTGDVHHYHPRMSVHDIAFDLLMLAGRAMVPAPLGAQSPSSVPGSGSTSGNYRPPTAHHHSGIDIAAHHRGMTQDEVNQLLDAVFGSVNARQPAAPQPQPTPCGWCGFTTGHAPTCMFVPREEQEGV